jgi:hypothetical protein
MCASDLRIQPVNATFYSLTSGEEDVVNEAKTEDLLHRSPESFDVGALAER